MQDIKMNLPRTRCPSCGKVVPRRDTRDTKPQYCGKICAGMGRFQTRYRGSDAGPFDRPVDIMVKTKWPTNTHDGLVSEIPEGA